MSTETWRFKAPLGPPLRRAIVAGIPVGGMILLDLGLSAGQLAGLGIGALLAGFVGFDSPSGRTRAVWQLGTAPFIAFAGALGALTGSSAVLAVATMIVFASVAGLTFAVSPRLYIAGASTTLALLIAQGLTPQVSDALEVFALAGVGALLQALFSVAASVVDRLRERIQPRAALVSTRAAIAANLGLGSVPFRHALRWGLALGAGVAAYRALDLGEHGYWVPLTVLFVLRPSYGETVERIAMRAAGTALGLLIATPVAELLGGVEVLEALAIVAAAAFSYALLAIEYALFTAAITSFAVIYAHAFGQPALQAADERAIATAIGLVIVAFAFAVFRDRPGIGSRPEGRLRPRRGGGGGAPSAT
jgi:hypothetical protein